ncbi:MAG: hypothetical protein LBP54_06560, partial [Campylobacteraceae bacterium]|nr:hypothetical protein [Campylobacteraceae bacterium]
RTVTEDITSYYQFSYLADINNTVGTITVNPNEIILIPAVNIDIELAYNSCKPVNLKEDGFLDKFFGSSHNSIIGALWDASTTENGFYTWTWSCPVKTFTIDIKTTLLSDFTIYTEAYTMSVKPQSFFALSAQRGFPIDLRERIVVRDFELGKMFKNAKKLKTLDDGTEQYIIYGNADEEQKDQIKAIKLFLALLCSITFTNANFGINNSNYQQKETVLTSITGGSVNIEVGGNTNLKGSLMLQEKDTLATTGNCIMFSLSSKNGEINVNV